MQKDKNDRPLDGLNKWIKFSGIAMQMGVVIVLGVWAGVWLDGKFPKYYPLFTVVLSLLGVFVALFSVIRQVKNMSDE